MIRQASHSILSLPVDFWMGLMRHFGRKYSNADAVLLFVGDFSRLIYDLSAVYSDCSSLLESK